MNATVYDKNSLSFACIFHCIASQICILLWLHVLLIPGGIPVHFEILLKSYTCIVQHPLHVVLPYLLVEVHRQLVVVHAIPHDNLTLLNKKGETEEHHEGVATSK